MDLKGKRPSEGQPSKEQRRRDKSPVRVPPNAGPSLTWTCTNKTCNAVRSIADAICTRCSCFICNSYDVKRDPSLWLECAPDSPAASSGLSCHIACAIREGMVCGSYYSCASCDQISGIHGCWKQQLIMAKDCRRVDALCCSINLSLKLLDKASGFQDIHEIVKEAKHILETEVGPLDGISANEPRGHGLVSKLAVGAEVKKLCAAAVEMADEVSTARLDGEDMSGLCQTVNPNTSNETGLNFICPDLNIDITGTDSDKEVAEGNGSDTAVVHDGNVECFFEYDGVMMIRRLECEKRLTSEVRLKLLTWLCVKSTEGERRILNAFIQAFGDDHPGLAAQLKSTFASVINAAE